MNSYSKPRVRIVGATSILLRGSFGLSHDFSFGYQMF